MRIGNVQNSINFKGVIIPPLPGRTRVAVYSTVYDMGFADTIDAIQRFNVCSGNDENFVFSCVNEKGNDVLYLRSKITGDVFSTKNLGCNVTCVDIKESNIGDKFKEFFEEATKKLKQQREFRYQFDDAEIEEETKKILEMYQET